MLSSPTTTTSGFAQGFLNNLLNPKVAIFYLAFLPQFIGPHDPVLGKSLLMAAIHAVEGILWLGFVAWATARVSPLLAGGVGGVKRIISGIAGAALVGFGVKQAVEE